MLVPLNLSSLIAWYVTGCASLYVTELTWQKTTVFPHRNIIRISSSFLSSSSPLHVSSTYWRFTSGSPKPASVDAFEEEAQTVMCNFKVTHPRCVCKHEYNVISTQNTTKFICFCCHTNISNYNYMFRPFLVVIIRLYIPNFKSYVLAYCT